jgi:hypothetical protein
MYDLVLNAIHIFCMFCSFLRVLIVLSIALNTIQRRSQRRARLVRRQDVAGPALKRAVEAAAAATTMTMTAAAITLL